MLDKVFAWMKARWQWGKGYCPACGCQFFGKPAIYNDCEVCKGVSRDVTIWHNWRHWKPPAPESSVKVLHKHKATATWKNKEKDVVIEEE